jgi:hypothetical protein
MIAGDSIYSSHDNIIRSIYGMSNFSEAEFLKSANSVEVLGLAEIEEILSRTLDYRTLNLISHLKGLSTTRGIIRREGSSLVKKEGFSGSFDTTLCESIGNDTHEALVLALKQGRSLMPPPHVGERTQTQPAAAGTSGLQALVRHPSSAKQECILKLSDPHDYENSIANLQNGLEPTNSLIFSYAIFSSILSKHELLAMVHVFCKHLNVSLPPQDKQIILLQFLFFQLLLF